MSIKTTEEITRKQAINKLKDIIMNILNNDAQNIMNRLTNEELEKILEKYEPSQFINYSIVENGGDKDE